MKNKLNELETEDVYSLILFALYKIKEVPEYSTLSELCYLLEKDTLVKFLSYYGGMTIKIPTIQEFKTLLNVLLLYDYINIEGMEFNKAVSLLNKDESTLKEIKSLYGKVSEILQNYEFKRN